MNNEYLKLSENDIKIEPKGWIRDFLKIQVQGLTGHIEAAGEPFISFSFNKWDQEKLDQMDDFWKWVPFEQTSYYLDGLTECARFLNDKSLKEKSDKIIYDAINNADVDGYIGPAFLKNPGKTNRWPHTIFFRAVLAKYNDNHDINLIKAIEKHYLSNKVDYRYGRNITNIEIMLRVYEITHNKELLDFAITQYDNFQKDVNKNPDYCSHYTLASELLNDIKPYEHGVTYNEIAKLGAILYSYTGNKDYLSPTIKAYKKIIKYHMLPDGLHSSNEFLRGNNPKETHETCNVSDFTWSLGYSLKATKDGRYADMIEKCIYNAGIGSVLENFKALQYFSGVNQTIVDLRSNHNFYHKGTNWMSYRPAHETQCCTGNVNRFFPNFVSRMWMKNAREIDAIFYGDSTATFKIDNKSLRVFENTSYPFSDSVDFSFKGNIESFNFGLRIPKWSETTKIFINGKEISFKTIKGFTILKEVTPNDKIKLELNPIIKASIYKKDGVIIERGPIVYSYGMVGKRFTYNDDSSQDKNYPAYNIYPDNNFSYALDIDDLNLEYINLKQKNIKWDIKNPPSIIKVNAYIDKSFTLEKKSSIISTNSEFKTNKFKMKGDFLFTKDISKVKGEYTTKERITLFPYGASKLRVTVFPLKQNKK